MEKPELIKIVSVLENFHYIRDVQDHEFPFFKKWVTKNAFLGSVTIDDKTANLIIGFDEFFPFSKPQFFISPFNGFGFIPHIDVDGYICFIENDIVVDFSKPKEIIEESFNAALVTLQKGYSKKNIDDFIFEFEDYWLGNLSIEKTKIISFISREHKTQKIRRTSITDIKQNKKILIGESDQEIKTIAKRIFSKENFASQFKSCLYVAIPESGKIYPPAFNTFWSPNEFHQTLFNLLSADEKKQLKEAANYSIGKEEIVVIAIKREEGSLLFGLRYKNIKGNVHPILLDDCQCSLTPLFVHRLEKDVILQRGGANSNLDNKNILLIGCGSIGSKLALEIIRTGVTKLSLVDNDNLDFENIYRHQLGKSLTGMNKAIALSRTIENDFPYATISSFNNKIETLVSTNALYLSTFDLIISATGSPNTNFYLNEYLFSNKIKTPIIYTWNEPYGIGGHGLLIQSFEGGCYRCLFNDLNNRASFCEASQNFSKKISGCSSTYIPFSSIDSLKSCTLCIELIKKLFNGEEKGNPLLSWKGSNTEFIHAGFKTSNRYQLDNKALYETRYQYINNLCPTCS